MELKNQSLALLNDVQRIYQNIRLRAKVNPHNFLITEDNNFVIHIKDVDYKSNFYFEIKSPFQKDSMIFYDLSFKPSSRYSIEPRRAKVHSSPAESIYKIFEEWIKNIEAYQKIQIHPANEIIRKYKDKIYESFKFLDDENNDEPLDFVQRDKISQLLLATIVECEREDEPDKEIIDQLKQLNTSLPQLTQGQVKERISWVFAKMQYLGIMSVNRLANSGIDIGLGLIIAQFLGIS